MSTFKKQDAAAEYQSFAGLEGVKFVDDGFANYRDGVAVVATEHVRSCLGQRGHFSIEWSVDHHATTIGVFDGPRLRALVVKLGKRFPFYFYPMKKSS